MSSNAPIAQRPARVLIVDDERCDRQLLEVMLAPEGYVLLTAEDGDEAFAVVAREPPDLILLDVRMPGTSGFDVVAKLKRDRITRNIPVIMVATLNDRDATMLGLKAGAEDFLAKPVDRAELCLRVRNLLRLKQYSDYHDKYGQMLESEVLSRAADLVASERLYRETFDDAPVGIVHLGLDGRWLRVNQRLCELLGYSSEEILAVPVCEFTEPKDVASDVETFRQMVTGTARHHVVDERQYRRKDGGTLWARINISVHRDSDGTPRHFISVIEDVTSAKVLEAQVRQASKLEAIGGLAAGISHDFNNLLSVVLSYSELLSAGLKDGDPMRDDLDEIRRAGMRAVELTRHLLAFSRQQILMPKVVDLSEVIRGMERMLGRVIGEDIDLVVLCGPSTSRILVDQGQMEQVIMNLAVNARDAMPRGGKLTVQTSEIDFDGAYVSRHVGASPGLNIVLSVSDTGSGMDAATQARIFEPFFTTKEVGKGTGLGLATVFGIVRQSGGTIAVDSKPAVGTTFRICFPAAAQGAKVRESVAPPSLPAGRFSLHGTETILVVEDDERVRSLACTILRKYGYEVLEAQSGGDALLRCEQHETPIHLLLTDLVMPRMNGRQLAERLHPLRPAMKVIYMSGYADDAVMRDGALDPTFAFIQKPITPAVVGRKVRDVLDGVFHPPGALRTSLWSSL